MGTPEGWLGEGRDYHTQRGPLMVRGSAGIGRDFRRIGELEGKVASVSPTHSGPGEPTGVPGLNLCPLGPLWPCRSQA